MKLIDAYSVGGFLIGTGIAMIQAQYKKDKANKIWEKAADGTREASV